jgi:hypothetical protein
MLVVTLYTLLGEGAPPFAPFSDYGVFPWFLPIYCYTSIEILMLTIHDKVIAPAEAKAIETRKLRQPNGGPEG